MCVGFVSQPKQTGGARVSIVVPTRNRPQHALACVRAILAVEGYTELIVVDQSDDQATELLLHVVPDPRLRYVRSEERGVTSARNLGIDLSQGTIVAFTDDDCRIARDWIRSLSAIFAADSDVAVVCGRVRVPDEMSRLGWAESFEPQTRVWRGRFPPCGQWGISANMALRRSTVERVGLFDPLLGAGAPLRSGGEPDFLFRVFRAGLKVINASEVVVDHVGIRELGDETRRLMRGYGEGTAAAFLKHARLGKLSGLRVYLTFLFATTWRVCSRLVLRKRPLGASYLIGFVGGTVRSLRFRVDRGRRQYVRRTPIRARR